MLAHIYKMHVFILLHLHFMQRFAAIFAVSFKFVDFARYALSLYIYIYNKNSRIRMLHSQLVDI